MIHITEGSFHTWRGMGHSSLLFHTANVFLGQVLLHGDGTLRQEADAYCDKTPRGGRILNTKAKQSLQQWTHNNATSKTNTFSF